MKIRFERNKTSTVIVIMYSLYLYFLGLSLRNTSKALTIFKDEKEVTYLSGTGFRDLAQVSDLQKIMSICLYNR